MEEKHIQVAASFLIIRVIKRQGLEKSKISLFSIISQNNLWIIKCPWWLGGFWKQLSLFHVMICSSAIISRKYGASDWPNIRPALSLASDTKQTHYHIILHWMNNCWKTRLASNFRVGLSLTMLAWSGCSAWWWPSWCRWSRCPRTECWSAGPSVLVISEISWARTRI